MSALDVKDLPGVSGEPLPPAGLRLRLRECLSAHSFWIPSAIELDSIRMTILIISPSRMDMFLGNLILAFLCRAPGMFYHRRHQFHLRERVFGSIILGRMTFGDRLDDLRV